LGSQWANGKGALEGCVVRRGSEVACVRRAGKEGGLREETGGLAVELGLPTQCVGARMDKRQNMSV